MRFRIIDSITNLIVKNIKILLKSIEKKLNSIFKRLRLFKKIEFFKSFFFATNAIENEIQSIKKIRYSQEFFFISIKKKSRDNDIDYFNTKLLIKNDLKKFLNNDTK